MVFVFVFCDFIFSFCLGCAVIDLALSRLLRQVVLAVNHQVELRCQVP